jgi:hypothetical protein
MSAKPVEPDTPPPEPVAQGVEAVEHVGPIAIERLRKDDGRSLILYSLDDERS